MLALVERLRAVALRASRRGEPLPGGHAGPGSRGLPPVGARRPRAARGRGLHPPPQGRRHRREPRRPRDAGPVRPAGRVRRPAAPGRLRAHRGAARRGHGAARRHDAKALDRAAGTPSLRTVKRWRADGIPVMVAVDVVPAPDATAPAWPPSTPRPGCSSRCGCSPARVVEWELAWPGTEPLQGPVRRWLDSGPGGGAVLTLDLVGVSRRARAGLPRARLPRARRRALGVHPLRTELTGAAGTPIPPAARARRRRHRGPRPRVDQPRPGRRPRLPAVVPDRRAGPAGGDR